MSKQIVVKSKNGSDNIRLSRRATRESNLQEDRDIWTILSKKPCSRKLPVMIEGKHGKLKKDKSFEKAMNVGHTISERIVNLYADHYNVATIDDVTAEMIQDVAKKYLTIDPILQLDYCRDPSRQSIDEDVQKATLEQYLDSIATVEKPTNGELTVINGDIQPKPKGKVEARSIDLVVKIKKSKKEFNIFAKYVAVAGSGQAHQVDESIRFIDEAKKYTHKHNDGKYFIVLTDGTEGEKHLPVLNARDIGSGYTNIFAGNCEQVIDFITKNK